MTGRVSVFLLFLLLGAGQATAAVGEREVDSLMSGLNAARQRIDELLVRGDRLVTEGKHLEAANVYQQALEMASSQGSVRQYLEQRTDWRPYFVQNNRFLDLFVAPGLVEEIRAKLRHATLMRYKSQFTRTAESMATARRQAQELATAAEQALRAGRRSEANALWSRAVDEYNRIRSIYEAAHVIYQDTARSLPMRVPTRGAPMSALDEDQLLTDAWNQTVGDPVLLGHARTERLIAIRRLSEGQLADLRARIDTSLGRAVEARGRRDWGTALDGYELAASYFQAARRIRQEMEQSGLSATAQTQAWLSSFGGGEQEQTIHDFERTLRAAVDAKMRPVLDRLQTLMTQAEADERRNVAGARARYEEAAALSASVHQMVQDPAKHRILLTTDLPLELTPAAIRARVEVMLLSNATVRRDVTIEDRTVGDRRVTITSTTEVRPAGNAPPVESDLTSDLHHTGP